MKVSMMIKPNHWSLYVILCMTIHHRKGQWWHSNGQPWRSLKRRFIHSKVTCKWLGTLYMSLTLQMTNCFFISAQIAGHLPQLSGRLLPMVSTWHILICNLLCNYSTKLIVHCRVQAICWFFYWGICGAICSTSQGW